MKKELSNFMSYIQSEGKHGLYQLFPPVLVKKYPELQNLPYNSMRLDDKRYDFLVRSIDLIGLRVTDIGSNIGYFSFRLATEKACKVLMYEPYADHFKAIGEIRNLLNLDEKVVEIRNEGVDLDAINALESTDVILLFNVLQHAGEDFDRTRVQKVEDWYAFAVEYLTKLRTKTKYLVFQNGYSWLGHSKDLCGKEEIISFSIKLLKEAGWQIEKCGIVTNFQTHTYREFDINKTTKNPIFNPLKYFEYGVKYRLGFNVPNHRFIQRPIFICKS